MSTTSIRRQFTFVLAIAVATLALAIESGSTPTFATEGNATAAVAESQLKLKTERAIVFKDGYCLIVKKGTATTDERGFAFTDDVPDAAILGSFWAIPDQGRLKSMVAGWVENESEAKREFNCTNVVEIIHANLGKTCSLTLDDSPNVKGTLLKLLNNDESKDRTPLLNPQMAARLLSADRWVNDASADSPESRPTIGISQTTGTHFILRTDHGDMMIAIASVKNLTIDGMKSTLEQTVVTSSRRKRLTMDFGKPNTQVELNLMYFRPGIRWIPTYRVELTDRVYVQSQSNPSTSPDNDVPTSTAKSSTTKSSDRKSNDLAPVQGAITKKTAEISLQGEILNEAEDLIGVPIHIVVGVPNFRFRSVVSPMVLESSLRNVLAQAAPSVMGGQGGMSNALYTQRSSEFSSNRANGGEGGANVDLPAELSGSGGNDLFVYQLEKMNIKKGERATVPILRTEVAYRDVYTWDIDVTHSENFAATASESPSPLVLTENKIWRQIEMINDTEIPWTTGAAMVVDGFQPLAQELLTYTSPGGICRMPVTVSVDLRGKLEDREVGRELNAVKWRRNDYARVSAKIDLELANNKKQPVTVEVKLRFGGKATQASDDGSIRLEPFRTEDWNNRQGDPINNSSLVTWTGVVEPGECLEPNVAYEFLLRY